LFENICTAFEKGKFYCSLNVNDDKWIIGDKVWSNDKLQFERFRRKLGNKIIILIVLIIVLAIGIISIIGY